jgi:hypothetical protein
MLTVAPKPAPGRSASVMAVRSFSASRTASDRGGMRRDDQEFFTAHARQHVRGAQAAHHGFGDLAQRRVADGGTV